MDTPPHRLGLERVVEVFSGHADLVGLTGSGYVVGADLVLTSGHVIRPGAPCHVRGPGPDQWVAAEPVWRGRGGANAVLLRVTEPVWADLPGIERTRFARPATGGAHRLRWLAGGFPQTGQREGARSPETLAGLVDAPMGAVSKTLAVSVLSPELESMPDSLWHGMSGAALLAEPAGQLIGVIATSPSGHAQRHLDAIPVTALLADERFRELAAVAPGPPETVAGDPSPPLPTLLQPARVRLPQDRPDWTLLMARHAVVPFLGRTEELAELRAWAADPAPLSIAVLTGRGGTGKTRLAGELCVDLAEAGWDTGFLPLDALAGLPAGTPPGPPSAVSPDALRPTLIVVDRPEPSLPLVGELIRRLAEHGHNPRVRLLLAAREPGEPDWWRRLDTAAGGRLRRLNSTTVQLNAHPLTLTERTEHASAAMKAFAPSRAALPSPPRLDDPEYGLPLRVHLAALLRLCDADGDAIGRVGGGDGLLGRFLARERDQWARVWPDTGERLDDVTARQAVAVLTLTAPSPAELPGLLMAVPGLRGTPHLRNAADWLGRVFPGRRDPAGAPGAPDDGRLSPLGPDLLVEEFLAGTESLDALVLAVHDQEGRTVGHLVRMLDVLRLSAGRERARAALWSLVISRIGRLVAEAVTNPASRLGDVLDAALRLFATDRQLAEAVAALPAVRVEEAGLGSRALAVTLAELAVRHRRARGGTRVALAGALARLSDGLAAVGRVGEAVVAAAEAVEAYAGAPPYEEAAGRAEALFGLGACLLLGGEAGGALKPAQEAAARFRILAEDDLRYSEQAARAHYNVACALLGTGRLEEAVAAFSAAGGDADFAANVTGVLSVLPGTAADRHPDGEAATVPRPRPGTSGDRLPPTGSGADPPASRLMAVGQPPEAPLGRTRMQAPAGESGARSPVGETGARAFAGGAGSVFEPWRPPPGRAAAAGSVQASERGVAAVFGEVPEPLAVQVPEPLTPFEGIGAGAALPELAACLAVAATSAAKGVAPTDRDLAHRLHLLAGWLETHGRPAEALAPAAEAVSRLRALAREEPGLRAMLASAAAVLSRLHAGLEDLDAAVRSAAEAVRSLRALVTLEPDEHRPALAGQLLDLGELLLIDDRPEEALGPLQEAMTVAAERDTAAQATGRRLLGLCLDELGRTADGLAQLEIAAELYDVLGAEEAHRSEVRARLRRRLEAGPAAGEEAADGQPWLLDLVMRRSDAAGGHEGAVGRAERRLAECREAVEGAGTPGIEQIHAYLSAQAVLARAWADAGRAGEGFALAMRAAELLERHAAPDGPHAIAVGMVAAALGRSLVVLGRHKEAIPHLLTAIESYEPHAQTSAEFRTELAELMILETVALSRAACPSDAEAAADRLVELYAKLVAEGLERPVALAGALRLQGGIRFTRQDPEGALRSVTRALDFTPSPPGDRDRLVAATCLELGGLCLAEQHESEAARTRLAAGTSAMARLGQPVPHDLAGVHLLALVRLARLRVEEEGPAAGTDLYAQILDLRPLPGTDELDALVEELAGAVEGAAAELVGPLTAFTEELEREVPLTGAPETYDRYGRCLAAFSAAAAEAGDTASAVAGAELAVRVYRGLAAVSGVYREHLGSALARLSALGSREAEGGPGGGLAVVEQAIVLLGEREDRTLAEALNRYAAELLAQGRPVEALAHCERAADLCDELDDPAVAAVTYAQLGSTLAALDRSQAALEAIAWSLAELDRAEEAGRELPRVRARAVQVRGRVLRAFGRGQEAMAHLVEALRLFGGLAEPLAAAETAALIADDLLADGRPQEAAEYARIATTGHEPGTVKHALATQRLARCHMMLGELGEANALVEGLIPLARRAPDDPTYRAILADSLAQSSELLPLLRLDGGAEAEARAREAIAIYDELLAAGMNAHALHTSRAGACLTLASALRMRELAAEAIQPLREAVAALERFSPDNPMQSGLLSQAMLMLGDALMEAGRALEAGLVFHRSTQVTRDALARAVAHARLGFCQWELGRDDAAEAALRVSADLLRELPAAEGGQGLLRDVLIGRLKLLETAGGRGEEARAVEAELRRLSSQRRPT
ncbi:hypothetical protein [Nonomuraea sp. KM90]|uniref:hypothetical protein n=1 Tax=Nonomuraea sp. KM90 TaxID=3457428 RepID=UPI003FCDCACF